MSDSLVKEVASQFSLSEEEGVQEGLKAFLQNEIRLLEVERQQILRKYKVDSFEELDNYLTEHPDQESDLLPDFERAEYLTYRIDQTKKLLKRVNGHD